MRRKPALETWLIAGYIPSMKPAALRAGNPSPRITDVPPQIHLDSFSRDMQHATRPPRRAWRFTFYVLRSTTS
jgi:hypothetical protein